MWENPFSPLAVAGGGEGRIGVLRDESRPEIRGKEPANSGLPGEGIRLAWGQLEPQ